MIKINHFEAKQMEELTAKRQWQLEKELKQLQARRRRLKTLIDHNDHGAQNWVIEISEDLLEPRREGDIKWKKLVMEVFESYQIPMSSELVCYKLWLHFPQVPFDKRAVLQNVSSALSSLEGRDGQLFRTKERGRKGYVYGLKHFFDFDFNLKSSYLRQYRREEGESEGLKTEVTEQTNDNQSPEMVAK
jgi:hypothetical protein